MKVWDDGVGHSIASNSCKSSSSAFDGEMAFQAVDLSGIDILDVSFIILHHWLWVILFHNRNWERDRRRPTTIFKEMTALSIETSTVGKNTLKQKKTKK